MLPHAAKMLSVFTDMSTETAHAFSDLASFSQSQLEWSQQLSDADEQGRKLTQALEEHHSGEVLEQAHAESGQPMVQQAEYKDPLHWVLAASFFSIAAPFTVWTQLDQVLLRRYCEANDCSVLPDDHRFHYEARLDAWEQIFYGYALAYGPMLIAAFIAESRVLEESAAFVLTFWLSNMHIPAHLYAWYQLYSIFVEYRDWEYTRFLITYIIQSIYVIRITMVNGMDAFYYLKKSYVYNDDVLVPYLFYWLNWVDHQ